MQIVYPFSQGVYRVEEAGGVAEGGSGMMKTAMIYAITPGKMPVIMTNRMKRTRRSVGSTLKYSTNPPRIPFQVLSVVLRYKCFMNAV